MFYRLKEFKYYVDQLKNFYFDLSCSRSPPARKIEMDDSSWESLTSFQLDRCELWWDDVNVSEF